MKVEIVSGEKKFGKMNLVNSYVLEMLEHLKCKNFNPLYFAQASSFGVEHKVSIT